MAMFSFIVYALRFRRCKKRLRSLGNAGFLNLTENCNNLTAFNKINGSEQGLNRVGLVKREWAEPDPL
jgi:hypothetical protein